MLRARCTRSGPGSDDIPRPRARLPSSSTLPMRSTLYRGVVLAPAPAHFPGLRRWTTWCHGQPSTLRFGRGFAVQSAAGAPHGDPLGPLLCAAWIWPSTWTTASYLRTWPPWQPLWHASNELIRSLGSGAWTLLACHYTSLLTSSSALTAADA